MTTSIASDAAAPIDPVPLLRQALAELRAAHRREPMPDLAVRLARLEALRRFVREHQDDLAAAISADYGHRSHHETLITEVVPVLNSIRYASRHLRRWMKPRARHVDRLAFGLARNTVVPQPLGVVGVIVPWNFPLNLSLVPLTFILAAGNRAMVKFSENSRRFAACMAQHLPRYLDADVVRVVDETGGVGVAFSRLPLDHLLFTGSSATGRAVMAAAASNLCPVTLELGGRSPAIVAADFDIRVAARRILQVKCLNAGQVCTTVDHVYVPRGRMADFVAAARAWVPRLYGDIDSPDYSAIIDRRAYDRLRATLQAVEGHAEIIPLLPGRLFDDERRRMAPVLVIDPPADSALMQREIFGPILPLVPYDSLDEVIERISEGPHPLALYPFSHDRRVIERCISQVMSGGVTVNDALLHVAQDDLPFGGVGESGMGHYHGREGFETFSKMRPVFHQARWSTFRLMAPPYGSRLAWLLRLITR